MKAIFTDKGCIREGIKCLCFYHVICHQVPCPLQELADVFLSVSFVVHAPAEAFAVALHILCQINIQIGFGFPKPILQDQTATLYFSWVTCPCFYHFLFMSEFSYEFLAYPCRYPATFVWFPTCQDGVFLSLEEVIVEYQAAFLDPSSHQGHNIWILPSRSLKKLNTALLKSRAVTLLFALLTLLRIMNSTISQSLQPSLPVTLISLISSS